VTARASASDPLGYDARIPLEPGGRSASGLELTVQEMIARLTCEKVLLVEAPDPDGWVDSGINVQTWVGEVVTQQQAEAKGPIIDEVMHRIERLDGSSIRVAVDLARAGARYNFTISISARTTTQFPISIVLGVGADGVKLNPTVEDLATGR